MLTESQQYFIKILRDFLNQRKTAARDAADWGEISDLAKRHQVSGIVYYQCGMLLPAGLDMEKESAGQLYSYAQNRKAAAGLDELFKDIPHVFVKGLTVAELYPEPALRSMGDIDLLIQEQDRSKVEEILQSCGYCLVQSAESVSVFHKNDVTVELHDSLIHSGIGNEYARMLFSDPWSFVKNGELDWSYHLFFLLQHLKGHLVSHGVGIRQFMDIAVVLRNKEIDWNWLKEKLEGAKMLRFSVRVFSLVADWFGVVAPEEVLLSDEEFGLEATEKILADGVFGHNNAENSNPEVAKQLLERGGSLLSVRSRYFLRETFPEYRKMCKIPYCSYVQKSIILLPAAWGHRILYRLFNRSSRKKFIERTLIPEEKVRKRTEMFRKWGIEP